MKTSHISGLLAAHFVADLPDALPSDKRDLPAMRTVLDEARSRIVGLIGDSVFPNRLSLHGDASVLSDLRSLSPERTLSIISHRSISSVGDADPLSVVQNISESLRLQGRIDGPEILQSALAIENALRNDMYRLTGDQAFEQEIPSAPSPERSTLPLRTFVCCDMDGVLATLRPLNGKSGVVGFRDTVLGTAVQSNAERFEAELLVLHGTGNAGADARDTEMGLLPYLVQNYGDSMEEHWFTEASDRIRAIYQESYPEEFHNQASVAAEQHIAAMPPAYHVFRHKTWDHDLRQIYTYDQSASEFAMQISHRGGKLIFITAAPRIHAVKMLAFAGIMQSIGPNGFELFSVEDLYIPGSVEDATFVEGDKGQILRRLQHAKRRSVQEFVMAGDQVHSDVLPATAVGVEACLVSGPQELAKYARLIRLPNDPESVAETPQ